MTLVDAQPHAGAEMSAPSVSFSPLASVAEDECDRHYREVHVPFARRMLRGLDQVLSYHTARAVAERDLAGGWSARPQAFRIIVIRTVQGRALELPGSARERVVQDHRRCLRDLRAFTVTEQVLYLRAPGYGALVKYVLELDRPAAATPGEGRERMADAARVLAEQADGAFGLRRVAVPHVDAEQAIEPIEEPSQRPLPQALPGTDRHAFVEVYADHHDDADDWFRRPEIGRRAHRRVVGTDPLHPGDRGVRDGSTVTRDPDPTATPDVDPAHDLLGRRPPDDPTPHGLDGR